MKKVIVLCSGGLDSVTAAHYLQKKLSYKQEIILFFDYGQRTLVQEKRAAKKCAKELGAGFVVIPLPWLGKLSTSQINRPSKKARRIRRKDLKDTKKESSVWYVPCRNTIFLSYALALSESLQIKTGEIWDIGVGFKCEGNDPYPDTTPEYLKEMNKLKRLSTRIRGKIIAPLIKRDKDEIICLGEKLGANLGRTYSCYVGAGRKHCGYCVACRLRQEAFYWAGVKDPTPYKIKMKDFRLAK